VLFLTLSTLRLERASEDGNTATLAAHKHLALIICDNVELRDKHTYIANGFLPRIRPSKLIDLAEFEQWLDSCVLGLIYVENVRWKGWVDVLAFGETLGEGSNVASICHVGVHVQLSVCIER
jgi:hypothetical protein